MRKAAVLLIFCCFCSGIRASTPDDTLAAGKTSRFLVFPFAIRSPETKWGFGGVSAFFFKPKNADSLLRTSDVNLLFLYTQQKQTVAVLGATVFFPEEKHIFRFQTSLSNYPDKFWGVGNDTPGSGKESYTYRQFFFNPQFLFRLYRGLYFGASYELQRIGDLKYSHGGLFDIYQVPGRDGGITSGAGIFVTWDNRNNAYSPSKGFFSEVMLTKFGKEIGSDFEFNFFSVDLRKFMHVGRNKVVGMQTVFKINDGETPIRYMAMLGGSDMMRGYYKGRFLDEDYFAFQAEYRQYVIWRLGYTVFGSLGQVSGSTDAFRLDRFHVAGGAGLRIMLREKEKLNLRVDYGFGENSSGLYVVLKEAF